MPAELSWRQPVTANQQQAPDGKSHTTVRQVSLQIQPGLGQSGRAQQVSDVVELP